MGGQLEVASDFLRLPPGCRVDGKLEGQQAQFEADAGVIRVGQGPAAVVEDGIRAALGRRVPRLRVGAEL